MDYYWNNSIKMTNKDIITELFQKRITHLRNDLLDLISNQQKIAKTAEEKLNNSVKQLLNFKDKHKNHKYKLYKDHYNMLKSDFNKENLTYNRELDVLDDLESKHYKNNKRADILEEELIIFNNLKD